MGSVFIRTIILYLFVITSMRLMGKRQLGELQPSELVVTIMISDLASVALQSTNIPLLYGIIPVLTLVCMEILLSFFSLKSNRFRKILTGSPCLIIKDGVIDQKMMKNLRLNLDDLFEALRMNKIKMFTEVKYAFIETNGQISIMPTAATQPPTADDMDLKIKEDVNIPTLIVKDGVLQDELLKKNGKDEIWLKKALESQGLKNIKDVFILSLNGDDSITTVKRERV